jgi:hypothetical protein
MARGTMVISEGEGGTLGVRKVNLNFENNKTREAHAKHEAQYYVDIITSQ